MGAARGVLSRLTEEEQQQVKRVASEVLGLFGGRVPVWRVATAGWRLFHHGQTRTAGGSLEGATVIHNYLTERADGTTAAERFFGKKPRSVQLALERLPNLPRPAAMTTPPDHSDQHKGGVGVVGSSNTAEQGYGVIAAVIEKSSALPASEFYEIRFRVEEILAQSVVGERIPAKKGTIVVLRLHVGYGGQIDDVFIGPGMVCPSLAPGTRYILTVKYDKRTGKYEHARGAAGAEKVTSVSPESRKFYRIIQDIASQPADTRVKRCRELVVRTKVDSVVEARLRSTRLAWLTGRVRYIDDKGPNGPDPRR